VVKLPAVALIVSALPTVFLAELALTVMVPALVSVTVVLPVELAAIVVAVVAATAMPPFPADATRLGVVRVPVEVTPPLFAVSEMDVAAE
jgi:hypothetical protein